MESFEWSELRALAFCWVLFKYGKDDYQLPEWYIEKWHDNPEVKKAISRMTAMR